MMRSVEIELKKLFYIPYMLLAVIGIIALCLMSSGASDVNGNSISIFSLMLQGLQNGFAEDIEQSNICMWMNGLGDWLIVFMPLLLTFGYISLLTGERQNGQVRFELIRMGNFRYTFSKILAGAIFGGIVLAAAYGIFGILAGIVFPNFCDFPMEEQQFFLEMYFGNSIVKYVFKRMVGVFLLGMAGSCFGIGVAIFAQDKYMLICLPFLLNYVYRQIIQKARFIQGWNREDGIANTWLYACQPDYLVHMTLDKYWVFSLGLMLAVYAVLLLFFYWNVRRGRYGG